MRLQKKGMSIITVSIAITLPISLVLYFLLFRPLTAPTIYDWASTVLLRQTSEQLCEKATFDRYKTPDIYMGKSAPLIIGTNSTAKKYKSTIKTSIEEGTNFAGHYAIASWSCGNTCEQHAITDRNTGVIVTTDLVSTQGIEYYATSSLLVINPQREASNTMAIESEYYTIKNGELALLCKKKIQSEF